MRNRPQLFARLVLAGIALLLLTLAAAFAGCASQRPARDKRRGRLQVHHGAPPTLFPESVNPNE